MLIEKGSTHELSFIILKPLGTQEPIRSEILKRLSEAGSVVGNIKINPTREQMFELYKSNGLNEDGTPKPYLEPMLDYYEGKEIEFVLILGENVLQRVDEMIGFWNPNESKPGEIRHLMQEYGLRYDLDTDYDNLIHSPATQEDMKREIDIFIEGISRWI